MPSKNFNTTRASVSCLERSTFRKAEVIARSPCPYLAILSAIKTLPLPDQIIKWIGNVGMSHNEIGVMYYIRAPFSASILPVQNTDRCLEQIVMCIWLHLPSGLFSEETVESLEFAVLVFNRYLAM
jgi:hypothetical protein